MKKSIASLGVVGIARHLLFWTVLVTPLAAAIGCVVAFFLWALDAVTRYRWQHVWLLWLLPVAGIAIHFLYRLWGKNAERGNNLIINEIHKPGAGVPARMGPLVLLTTLITHLFGGSAGREGTAVQLGGSMAAWLARMLKLQQRDVRILLSAGVAAGFSAVFGTPIAGTIFAIEVIAIGRIKYEPLLPCLIAAFVANAVVGSWGIEHTQYAILFQEKPATWLRYIHVDVLLLAKVVVSGIAFGLAGWCFVQLTEQIKKQSLRIIKTQWLIPVMGGCIVIGLTYLAGTGDYLGLGVTSQSHTGASIVNAFTVSGVDNFSWLWKLLFTAVTLGMGFKGGEVTPLFFIGATLGNTLAVLMGAPVDLMAGLGFIAVFAGAANTPLACTLMGVELFGGQHLVYYAVACLTAYYFSGHNGIYAAQRVAMHKQQGDMDAH